MTVPLTTHLFAAVAATPEAASTRPAITVKKDEAFGIVVRMIGKEAAVCEYRVPAMRPNV